MLKRVEDALRDAWHGPLPLRALARRHRLTPRAVQYFWEGEKAAGRLPAGARPHFAANTSYATAPLVGLPEEPTVDDDGWIGRAATPDPDADDDGDDDDFDDGLGGRVRERLFEANARRASDALLERLQRAHPDYDPALQDVPFGVLALEHRKPPLAPSDDWLRRRARESDARMEASRVAAAPCEADL